MSNGGTNGIMSKLRDVIENGGNLDVNTRDVLLFSAIIDIYEQNENAKNEISSVKDSTKIELAAIRKEIAPALTFTQIGIWVAGIAGAGVIAFAGALLTGQIEVIVR